MYQNFDDLRDGLKRGDFDAPPLIKTKKLPLDHVFDYDKSVKWNHEMIKLHNLSVDEQRSRHVQLTKDIESKFDEGLMVAIQKSFAPAIARDSAAIIFAEAYSSAHSEGYYAIIDRAEEIRYCVYLVLLNERPV